MQKEKEEAVFDFCFCHKNKARIAIYICKTNVELFYIA